MAHLLTIKAMADPSDADLAMLKTALGQSASEADELLMGYLTSAMLKVQDYDDRSILDCTMELLVSEREDNAPIRLYQSVEEVLSVTDGKGEALEYVVDGNVITPARFSRTVVVNYNTKVIAAEKLALTPKVHRYAAALYDGADAAGLGRILVER